MAALNVSWRGIRRGVMVCHGGNGENGNSWHGNHERIMAASNQQWRKLKHQAIGISVAKAWRYSKASRYRSGSASSSS